MLYLFLLKIGRKVEKVGFFRLRECIFILVSVNRAFQIPQKSVFLIAKARIWCLLFLVCLLCKWKTMFFWIMTFKWLSFFQVVGRILASWKLHILGFIFANYLLIYGYANKDSNRIIPKIYGHPKKPFEKEET